MKYFRGIRWLFCALASLQLAVVLVALDVGVLAWATLIESWYHAPAAHFGIYDTHWFLGLNVLLAASVLGAVWIRFPWKRRLTGFVLTHVGVLVLLAGCLMTRIGGIEAQLPVFEGHAAHFAYTGLRRFELRVVPAESLARMATGPSSNQKESPARRLSDDNMAARPSATTEEGKPIWVPFISGPFPWADYSKLSWFPWRLASRSEGMIYNRGGVSLEVLDYWNDPLPCVRARLGVDGKTEEFELVESDDLPRADQRHTVVAEHRGVSIMLRPDEVDLGFQVYLQRFRRKLDPGSDTASHYSSLVDFLDRNDPPRRLQQNVLITLNAPVDFADPKTGRSWRFFQSGFEEAWKPGHPQFDRLVGSDHSRDQVYLSRLSINYDPGRGMKYLGSLMVVLGMVVVYFLRTKAFHTEVICP